MAEDIIDNPDRDALAEANRDAIHKLLTGADPGDFRERVRLLVEINGGRKGGTRAVAEMTGRSQRTVQRWITGASQKIAAPKDDATEAIGTAFEEARSTREGRAKIAAGRRATLLRNNGARMTGNAPAGPVSPSGSRAYIKNRRWDHAVGSDVMDSTFDAYIEGGEDAAFGAFNEAFGNDYGADTGMFDEWMFTDLSGLSFNPDLGS